MSLLIEKMIMPEQGAYEARLVVFKEGKASLSIVTGNVITTYDVSELPPHGRLIDADKLLACLNALEYIAYVEGGRPTFEEALEEIAKSPTIIEAEE